MDISIIFKIFCFVFLAIAAIIVIVSMVASFRSKKDSSMLRTLFRDSVFIAILFGLFSWLLS